MKRRFFGRHEMNNAERLVIGITLLVFLTPDRGLYSEDRDKKIHAHMRVSAQAM